MAPIGAGTSQDTNRSREGTDDKGVAEIATDLWQLVRDYAKQETVDPLKSIGRFVAWGLGGALLLAIGFVFISLGVLRGLQTQTGDHLTGSYTWVPYLVTLIVDVAVVAYARSAIRKPFAGEEDRA